MVKWINVKDRLPPTDKGVLLSNGKLVTAGAWSEYNYFSPYGVFCYDCELEFTPGEELWWAELPEPPKK